MLDDALRMIEPHPPKRKRGRPRKVPAPAASAPGEAEGGVACAVAASSGSARLLPGSALPSLGLPTVPSLLLPARLSGSGDLFTPLCRRAPPRLQLRSCTTQWGSRQRLGASASEGPGLGARKLDHLRHRCAGEVRGAWCMLHAAAGASIPSSGCVGTVVSTGERCALPSDRTCMSRKRALRTSMHCSQMHAHVCF